MIIRSLADKTPIYEWDMKYKERIASRREDDKNVKDK